MGGGSPRFGRRWDIYGNRGGVEPIGRDLLASILGLASAVSWGAGDFVGGLTARRAHVLGVVVISQGAGVLFLISLALVRTEPLPTIAALSWASAAGLSGGVGLTALYRALAVGQMGIAAPITAVIAAALPVLYGVLSAGIPGTPRLAGFAIAIAGIWRISRGAGGRTDSMESALRCWPALASAGS